MLIGAVVLFLFSIVKDILVCRFQFPEPYIVYGVLAAPVMC